MAPDVAPAPTTVWISSMNSTILPLEEVTSLMTAFSRSSNSPRYFAPATRAPRSRAMRDRPCRAAGTSPSTMRWARPSATAVLPTPGSPIRTGLFLVRRDRIWMARRISSSRPITGSSLPSRAACVKSRAYLESASYLPSGSWSVTRAAPRTCLTAASRAASSRPSAFSRAAHDRVSAARARSRCSTDTKSSPIAAFSSSARVTAASRFRPRTWPLSPLTLGCLRRWASTRSSRAVGLPPATDTARRARPDGVCSRRAFRRCSVSTIWWEAALAASGAATTAAHAFSVKSSWEMRLPPPPPVEA